jgi:hypothetical protein
MLLTFSEPMATPIKRRVSLYAILSVAVGGKKSGNVRKVMLFIFIFPTRRIFSKHFLNQITNNPSCATCHEKEMFYFLLRYKTSLNANR